MLEQRVATPEHNLLSFRRQIASQFLKKVTFVYPFPQNSGSMLEMAYLGFFQ
jgi:hypothetical protein